DRENEAVRESFLQASSFIGRDAELQTLTDDLNKVLQGGNAFYLVGGESGVGKSRLLNELRVQGLVAGATVLRGQAVENGGLPFQLWRQIVRRLLLIVNVSDAQASLLKDLVPDINDFLGRSIPDTPTLTGKARQEQIITTIVDLIHSVEQPLILLLEDLQWTNESLIVLKHLLLAREQFTHLMIVGNYRNDEAPNLPNELAPVDIIHLERLTSEAVQQLSHSMLGKNGATEHVLELLQNETEGNLFFLVETVRALAEEAGSLDRIGKSTLPDKVFTGGMQRLMQRRLNKVDEQYQPIQTLAAVLGRQIDEALLQQHYPEHTINEWLYLSDNLAILQVQDNQWQFTHDKLREFILTHMDTQSAQHYHRLAAEAIETAYPDDPAYNEILLTHWHKTGNLDKEMHYAKPILESYLFIQDRIPEAEILIEQSLDRLPENDARRIFLLNWLAYAYLWFRRDTDRAAVIVEEAYQLAKAHDDVNGLAFSLNQLGNVAKRRKQYQQAEAYYKQSMGYDQMIDSHFGVASNLLDLGQIAQIYGDYQQAQDYYEQSIAIQQSIDDYRGIAVNYSHLGLLAIEMGNFESAEDYFQQSVTLSQRIKHQTGIAHNLYRLSAVQFMQYKNHEAHDGFAKAMPIFEEINFPHGVVWCLNGLCRATLQQDDKEQVAESLYKSLSLTIDLNREQLTLYTLATIALYYHHTREHKKALAIASFIASYPPITKIDHILLDTDLDLATFEAKLSADEIQVAVERGKKWDVDMLVRDLLSEFSAVANRSD
ncbi:MAG: tetratricopeptide repeat protein, partial [Chloroflexota bacterium]